MSRHAHYDVIITGAGAGGATAAYYLGQEGARVLVLEKAPLPRHKPCGGATPRTTCQQFPFDFQDVIECETQRVSYCWAAGEKVTFPLQDRPVVMVMRDQFDLHILSRAQATIWGGVGLRSFREDRASGVTVTTESGESVSADYLIGADGAHSLVARTAGLCQGRRLMATIEAEVVPHATTLNEYANGALFDFGAVSRGYLWIFAKRSHLSVGIALFAGKCKGLRQILENEMRKLGVDLARARLYGHTLPLHAGTQIYATSRTLVVGDAAGMVDPLSGEGIRHAVASGRLAAQAILEGQVAAYSARLAHYARRAMGPSLMIAPLFYRHTRPFFVYAVRNPRTTRLLSRWISGAVGNGPFIGGLGFSLLEGIVRR